MLDKRSPRELNHSLWMIRVICKVVLTTMKPIESLIKKNTPLGGFSPQSSAA
mgnify:CR=1 FL=1